MSTISQLQKSIAFLSDIGHDVKKIFLVFFSIPLYGLTSSGVQYKKNGVAFKKKFNSLP